ncbi:MAG TPA: lysine-sensitive aspartokinase 3 [Thermoanaerobaculia bacterium]|jgi:aspartate kinase|nr:lysine-sensitive aspartokinase 3 [Thermoanaerobaculia bacterium]
MIIQKFGGTSLEDAPALERVCAIVAAARERCPVVVVSAIGETTDRLVEALERAAAGEETRSLAGLTRLQRDTQRHLREFFGDGAAAVEQEIAPFFDELARMARAVAVLRSVPPAGRDHFLAHGEMTAARLVSRALAARSLPAVGVDSREIVVTDDRFGRAQPDLDETARRVRDRVSAVCARGEIPVAAGYIGSSHAGATTTLGRGGSDYTAALYGAALDAEAVEIWTDVDGMMTADPRIVSAARPIETISFEEASELAYFGARVLHPLTLAPAIEKGIPIRVKNSRRPEFAGTEIRASVGSAADGVRSIAFKRGIATVDIVTSRMLMAAGFLRTLFEVFARWETPVDMVTTSEISVSVTVDDLGRLPEIRRDLERFAAVEVGRDRAIVCLVGSDIKFTPGIAARIFRTIEDVNVLMISQGASRRNVSFVIEERDVEHVVRSLHREFFESDRR